MWITWKKSVWCVIVLQSSKSSSKFKAPARLRDLRDLQIPRKLESGSSTSHADVDKLCNSCDSSPPPDNLKP